MSAKIHIPRDSPFSIHNIPFGVISTQDNKSPRCAAAIGDYAIDLAKLAETSRLDHLNLGPSVQELFSKAYLNDFAALPQATRQAFRESLIKHITDDDIPEQCLVDLDEVTMHLPMRIGGYSDFYCSLEHVQNCSETMSAGASIPENWFYAPSVYNSRVSSVIPSGHPVRRPHGVYYGNDGKATYSPSQQIDYELEMGLFVSKPVPYGSVMDINNAEEHIFGFVLLNDWSARDLQVFEMKPLGPFHGKDALKPFQSAPKWEQKPPPFDHLRWTGHYGTYDIKLEVELKRNGECFSLGSTNLRYLYWTPFQQLAHHASAMCGLETGDLIGTGTISGDATDSKGLKLELGCLYEATKAGTKEAEFPNGFKINSGSWKYCRAETCRAHTSNRPLTALYLGSLIAEAEFLPGVVNIVPGFGQEAGSALTSHLDVKKISFTGSTPVGKSIIRVLADTNVNKVTLELGGKSPAIVFDDADLDKTVEWLNEGMFYNMGYVQPVTSLLYKFADLQKAKLLCKQPHYVQEGTYEAFVSKSVARAKKNTIGDPLKTDTFLEPQIDGRQRSKIMGMVEKAKSQGATCATGGTSPGGWFIEPTIFRDVIQSMEIMQEEVFGPVIAVDSFKHVDDALARAHDSCYGLASAVFTADIKIGIRVAKELQAGSVWVNCYNQITHALPFGGYRQSGNGKDLGSEALDEFLQTKTVRVML
ncbi:hypothetical protein NW762_013240 [Fusarium torreyae]|uniref:Aldehyde dehydrogenase n=1 Tax=Fusarium torreyae TaxID=1237075 RepID=A0A9W8VAF8_9HYPO|nr:hypothetical protein NW762_013240 [Fusarium torreyae]